MSSLEVRVVRPDEVKKTTLTHERLKLDFAGDLAVRLLQTFACVGIPDGETSSGESKMRPQNPAELVNRAVYTTELMLAALHEQEWIVEMPDVDAILKDDSTVAGFRSEE